MYGGLSVLVGLRPTCLNPVLGPTLLAFWTTGVPAEDSAAGVRGAPLAAQHDVWWEFGAR